MMHLSRLPACLLLLIVVPFTAALAQGRIRVLDSETGDPVAGASVRFQAADGGTPITRTTDTRGVATNPFTGRALATATHVSYGTASDMVDDSGERTLLLHPRQLVAPPVVVTGQMNPTSTDRSLVPVRVIDRAQIESRSARTLRDLLSGEAGISLSNDQILGTSLSLQGLSGQNVKILVDGVPVVGRLNGSIDLAQIPVANAERVEIVEGPMSVLYGTDALGGVVNIITSRRARGAYSATVHGAFESVGSYVADTRATVSTGDTRIWVAGGRTLFTGYANPDTSRSKSWKPREQSTADLDITQFLGEHTVGISAGYLNDYILNRGEPRLPYRETAFDDTYRTQRLQARALAQGPLGGAAYEISIAYSGYVRRKESFLKNLVTLESTLSSATGENDTSSDRAWNMRARLGGALPFDSIRWDAGAEATIDGITGARIEQGEQHQGDYAVYARLEYSPAQFLTLQPGVRFTYNTLYPAPIVPSLQIKIGLDTALALRMSYGRGFRAPSLQELHFSFVDINHDIHGNLNLRAETSHNLNAGLEYSRLMEGALLEAGISGYYNAVKDLITLVADSNSVYSYGNIGDVKTIGGSISSAMRWQRAMIRASVGLTGSSALLPQDAGVPEFVLTPEIGAEARWRVIPALELAADYKYTARVPHYATGAGGTIERAYSDDYHLLNASVAYTLFGDRATLRASVRNIANVTDISVGLASQASVHSSGSSTVPVAWGRSFILDLQLRIP